MTGNWSGKHHTSHPYNLGGASATLIWNDLCQEIIFGYSFYIFYISYRHFKVQAASTMNQSDIRGLVRQKRTRADINIFRRELLPSTVANSVRCRRAYRIGWSHIALIVPAPVSIILILNLQISKELRRRPDEKDKNIIHHAAFLFFLSSYSFNTAHINPASSLAIATVTLHGILPRQISR